MAHLNKGHSEQCCSIPPVTHDYQNKGTFKDIGGLKTYVTGPSDAEYGIFVVYDVFGHSPQALQGADILATSDHTRKYQVFIPDLLEGQYADHAWFPPDTEEKQKAMGAFFGGPAKPQDAISKVTKLVQQYSQDSGIKKWGLIGFCWGGKIITLTLQSSDVFSVAASCHPAMVDGNDAKSIKIPFLMLPSKDEDAGAVKDFEANLTSPHTVETFADQPHGWMGARADLKDNRAASEYQRGYQMVLDFFHKHF